MKIKVRCKRTKETIEIEEDEFKDDLHERISSDPSNLVAVDLETLKAVVREVTEETVTERLEAAGVGVVDRSKVAVQPGETERGQSDRISAGAAARVYTPELVLYRELPEWERAYRTPDTDHWVAEWFRGRKDEDHGRMARAHAEIGKLPGFERDLKTDVDTSLIPSPIAASVMELKRKRQVFGPRALHIPSTSNTVKVPRETTFASVQRPAEGAAVTPDDPTWGDYTLTLKNSVVYTRSSNDMIEDSPFGIVQMLSRGAARGLALEADLQDVETGDGTGQNQTDAILNNGSVTAITFAVAGTITYLELNKLYRAIGSEWRGNAIWVGNNTVAGFLDDMLDGNGRPILADGVIAPGALEGGQGAMSNEVIKRRPFFEIPISVDILIFGDPQAFGILEKPSIRAEVSRDVNFLNDQIVWKWVVRRDGAVGQAAGFAKTPAITAVA